MEILRELILGPVDLDRLWIKCKSCGAEFGVSLNLLGAANATEQSSTTRSFPSKCPSCPRDWSGVHNAVRDFAARLEELKQHDGVSFRVTMPARELKGE
jgi:hypothetical protein